MQIAGHEVLDDALIVSGMPLRDDVAPLVLWLGYLFLYTTELCQLAMTPDFNVHPNNAVTVH